MDDKLVTLSLCMIVKDEEEVLAQCLDSVKDIVDEIIIVDTGSTDHTREVAARYTNKIFEFEWMDDFAAARNYSFSKATMEFIFWMDADDVILEKDREILKLLKSDLTSQIDTVIMKYILKRDELGDVVNYTYRERILNRERNYQWKDPIHEYINFAGGTILHTEIAVTHTKEKGSGDRNLKILRKVIANTKEAHPRHLFYYANENYALGYMDEAKEYYLKFLDTHGDAFSHYIESCIALANIYMQRNERKKALSSLTRTFEYGPMRAEALCLIGTYYREQKDYITAISWYELTLSLAKPAISWQYMLPEYWDLLPSLELCHCYYMIGDLQKAVAYHKQAQLLKPYHPAVIQNQEFFDSVLNQESEQESVNF